MNNLFGVSTGIAVVAIAKAHAASRRDGSFGDTLISEGGEAAVLGHRWNEGAVMIADGRKLAGWFAGRRKNLKARALIDKGFAIQEEVEAQYDLLKEAN